MRDARPLAQDIPLRILYEDADLIIIDKLAAWLHRPWPAGWHACQRADRALRRRSDGTGGEMRPDRSMLKDTSGVMLAAKASAPTRD